MRNYFRKVVFLVVFFGFSVCRAGSYEDFFQALGRDDASTVRALLQRGFDANAVDPEGRAALILAMRQASWAVAQVLVDWPETRVEVRTPQDESPLMLAALRGQLGLCRQLIGRDADVNKPGWAPLHYAATSGNPQVVRLLLEHYAYIDAASPNGSTPLMMAAMYGSPDAVQVLLDAGADPLLRNTLGLSALDFAQRAAHADAAERIAAVIRRLRGADW